MRVCGDAGLLKESAYQKESLITLKVLSAEDDQAVKEKGNAMST